MSDDDELDSTDDEPGERRGVVWVDFVKDRIAAGETRGTTVPMPGVPRVGEIVDLNGGQTFPADFWQVVQVIWRVPVGFAQDDLVKVNLSDLPPVTVHLVRVPEQKAKR